MGASQGVRHQAKRKSPAGITTSDLVYSAYVGDSADIFPKILALHVPDGALIADVTYGKGVFWRHVPPGRYRLLASDITTGVDCRSLPYRDASLDCVVLDPPHMEGFYRAMPDQRACSGRYASFREAYAPATPCSSGRKYHQAVLDLYLQAGAEVYRVLRRRGVAIVKCQDEVSANKQHLTHVEIINAYQRIGFYVKDLFVLVRPWRPAVSRIVKQKHARKNHSYFIVFLKT